MLHGGFLLGGMALVVLFQALGFSLQPRAASAFIARFGGAHVVPPGGPARAWGHLEFDDFSLEQPEDALPDCTRPLEIPAWFFENFSAAQLTELFNTCALTGAQKTALLDTAKWRITTGGVALTPSREVIFGLSHAARPRIYDELERSEVNLAYRYPYRFRRDGFEEWFAGCNFPAEKLELLRRLTYTNAGALCLADLPALQPIFSTNEFRALFGAIYMEPTVLARLWVTPDSDINMLAAYWGRGGRVGKIKPLLKSLAKVPGGGHVNISYLLPTFARLRLYTFSPPAPDTDPAREDCFWTALNFFNEKPDIRLDDRDFIFKTLQSDYAETREAATYGDLVLLLDAAGKTIHVCVYLAEDIVFTKNGADYLQPRVLMKMPDMLARYASNTPNKIFTLRPKKKT